MRASRGRRSSTGWRARRVSFHRGERWYGRFERHLSLPVSVQADKVKATYRDGVLTITLPKAQQQERSHKIQIQSQGQTGSGRMSARHSDPEGSESRGTAAGQRREGGGEKTKARVSRAPSVAAEER